VTSRNVVFNESVMYKDTLKDSGAGADREPRTRTKPLRFRDESNMAAYAFAATEEEDTHELLTYQEVVACEDGSKWKTAMKEEIDSLRKNKTWELIKEGIEGVQKPRYKARLVARGFTQRAEVMHQSLLKREFDMKDLEEAKKILGTEIGVARF
nr:hypothetical protein [Tanacetum cinerariifolium]